MSACVHGWRADQCPHRGRGRVGAGACGGIASPETLRRIQRSDPDGWETREPTDADRDAFRRWAIATYGRPVWAEYAAGGWAS